jgi:sugar phosphate isomerase/epimerase
VRFSVFSVAVPDWTPEESATNLKAIGYDGVAWRITDQEQSEIPSFWIGNRSTWPLTGLEQSLPEMRRLADQTGLEIAAFYGYPRWNDRDAIRRHFAAAVVAGVTTCRVVGPGEPTKSGPRAQLGRASYDALLQESRTDLSWVADCAADHGVRAVTPLHHEWVNSSASAARRLLGDLDPAAIGIIADFGHLVIEGWEDPLATVQILGPYLDSIMLKNYGWHPTRQRDDGTILWEYRTESLREGRVDVFNVFAALNAEAFDGWVTIAEATTRLPLYERLTDVLSYVKSADASTKNAKSDEWVYGYAAGGGMWAGLEHGRPLERLQ